MKNPDVTDCLLPEKRSPDVVGPSVSVGKDAEKRGKKGEMGVGGGVEEEEEEEDEGNTHWMDVFKHDFWGTDINSVRPFLVFFIQPFSAFFLHPFLFCSSCQD